MYVTFTIVLLLLLLCMILFHFRKRKVICKVRCMSPKKKCGLLNELVDPFGYWYDMCQDIFSSATNSWQGNMGYTALYDKWASVFNMVFDCQPVYFNYDGRTWLIEFWKGQYGINTGAEIGIYRAETIIPPSQRSKAIYTRVPKEEMLSMRLSLYKNGRLLASLTQVHWWLTIFCTGMFSEPSQLSLRIAITFPCLEMQNAFVNALSDLGYPPVRLHPMGNTLFFSYQNCPQNCQPVSYLHRFIRWSSQVKNKFFCRLFLFVTRPFQTSMDRALYLYFYLPFAFRRTLRFHRFRKSRQK